jgi:succinylarginine dihydrolase
MEAELCREIMEMLAPQHMASGKWPRPLDIVLARTRRAAHVKATKEGLKRAIANGGGPNALRFEVVLGANDIVFADDLACAIRIHGMSHRAQNVLGMAKVKTLQELRMANAKTMKKWKNCGAKTLTELLAFRK